MKGLLRKDFYTSISSIRWLLILCCVSALISLVFEKGFCFVWGFVFGISSFLGILLPTTALAYDDQCKWNRYGLMLPIDMSKHVWAKYVFGYLCVGIGGLISLVFSLICYRFDPTMGLSLSSVFLIVVGTMLLSTVVMSINLPFVYRFGVVKGKIFLFATTFLLFSLYSQNADWLVSSGIVTILQSNIWISAVLLILTTAVFQWGSVHLSIRFFLKTSRG